MITEAVNRAILDVLYACGSYQLKEETLCIMVNMKLDALAVSSSELKEHLQFCKGKDWIDYEFADMSQTRKWWIKPAGKVVRS